MEQLKLNHESELATISNREVEKSKKVAKLIKEVQDEKRD